MGSNDESATHPALQRADEEIARIAAMTPEEIADYIQGAVDEGEAGMDEDQQKAAAMMRRRGRLT